MRTSARATVPTLLATAAAVGAFAAPADAAQVGWDRDHAWGKITYAEVAQGGTYGVCMGAIRLMPVPVEVGLSHKFCVGVSKLSKLAVRKQGGIWFEAHPSTRQDGKFRIGKVRKGVFS